MGLTQLQLYCYIKFDLDVFKRFSEGGKEGQCLFEKQFGLNREANNKLQGSVKT